MTIQYKILLIFLVLLVNTLISLGYFLVGFIITRKNKEKKLRKYIILSIFMFLCPVAGSMLLGCGAVLYKIFFDSSIDLAAITFSKERVDVLERPDVETEINLVPGKVILIHKNSHQLRAGHRRMGII